MCKVNDPPDSSVERFNGTGTGADACDTNAFKEREAFVLISVLITIVTKL